jgi:type IV pilus assembly protein PilC
MNAEELAALNDQIAGMARAGLPLDQGLAGLAREMGRGRLRQVTEDLAHDLQAGQTLPEALERQAGRVPPYYARLVTAGVRTGRVYEVLATLTAYARTVAATRSMVIDALFYPAVVFAFAFALFVALVAFILPQFDKIFSEFGMKLPVATEMVLVFGRAPLLTIGLPLALAGGALFVAWTTFRFTDTGRRAWARLLYAVPVIGTLLRSARLAAFTDLLAVLVEHGLPLPEAFRLAGESSSDPLMAEQARDVHDRLVAGQPLAEALRGRGLVPEWVAWMAGGGEQRGTLGPALQQVAAVYRRQVDSRATVLRSILPPFMIITISAGIVPGLFLVFLPLFKLLEGLSK